jgi:hypothetical protein
VPTLLTDTVRPLTTCSIRQVSFPVALVLASSLLSVAG